MTSDLRKAEKVAAFAERLLNVMANGVAGDVGYRVRTITVAEDRIAEWRTELFQMMRPEKRQP